MGSTAPSWDSFKDALIKVLAEFKPKTVLEWGPGVSTLIMQDFPSIEKITTIEHDMAWFGKWQGKFGPKINLVLNPDMKSYPYPKLKADSHDLVFVDGREREKCLITAYNLITHDGVVIIHDAERESYKKFINMYKYIFYEDDGHTAVLTNSPESNARLEKIFEDCLSRA